MLRTLDRLILSLAVACMVAQSSHADLAGHWKLDEGTGVTVNDSSAGGNNGTFEGDPAWVAGAVGWALEFDGDDWVNCGTSSALSTTGPLTVACWINPTALNEQQALLGYDGGYTLKANVTQLRFTAPAILDHSGTSSPLANGTWQHVAVTFQPSQAGGLIFYINGVETERLDASAINAGTGPFRISRNQWGEYFTGRIDEVRIYNQILTATEIQAAMEGEPFPFAVAIAPKEGIMLTTGQATLEWKAGDLAVSHDIYFGQDKEAVANATTEDADLFVGNTTGTELPLTGAGARYPDGLTPGATYYWRIDEVDDSNPDSPWKGPIWSFWIQPVTAYAPVPADGAKYTLVDQDMSWAAGQNALYYTVYSGESFETVDTATAGVTMTTSTTYDPGMLATDTTYYWRIDTFTKLGTMERGPVWSFQTLPEITVADESLLAWWKLDEGTGSNVLDWSGHAHHGTLGGNPQWVGGYAGAALSFDGKDDYVGFGTPSDLYLPETYSYCVWFKVATNVFGNIGTQYLLCFGSRSDLIFGVEDNVGVASDLMLHYYDTAPGFHAVGVGQVVWDADQWHLVVGTKDAAGHSIYLDGQLMNSDTNTNNDNYNTTRIISLGARAWTSPQIEFFHGLIDEVRVYNRALTENEIQDLRIINPLQASEPSPVRDATVDIRDMDSLSWVAGDSAASHDVYFGADRSVVAAAGRDAGEFKGNQSGTSFPTADLVTFGGGTYYWRIDEVEADGTTHPGDVWAFTVPAYLLIDDFESYIDDDVNEMTIYQTWIDGYTNHTSNSVVGYMNSLTGTFGETVIVHGGGQSMPLAYDDVNTPYFSEAERTWASAQDWTAQDVDTLTLYFRGSADNGLDELYVALTDGTGNTAIVTHEDPEAAQALGWTAWNIPLSQFVGVNRARIKTMYIGLGDRTAPTPGGSGILYIDDIRLTRSEP